MFEYINRGIVKYRNGNILKSDNCYLDYSEMQFDSETEEWGIKTITKDFENQETVKKWLSYFRINCNDNASFKNLESIGEFDFIDWIDHDNFDTVHVNFKDFTLSTDEIKFSSDYDKDDYYFIKDLDFSKSLIKEINTHEGKQFLVIIGGFNNKQIVMLRFGKPRFSNNNDMRMFVNGEEYIEMSFHYDVNQYGLDYRYYNDVIDNISINATVDDTFNLPSTTDLFTTYYTTNEELKQLKIDKVDISSVLMNVYTFPLKVNNDDLIEKKITINKSTTNVKSHIFKSNNTLIPLFKFTIPAGVDVHKLIIQVPYNSNIEIDKSLISNNILEGIINYEVDTNTTTLMIYNDNVVINRCEFKLYNEVPYKIVNEEKNNFIRPSTRISYYKPTLIIITNVKSEHENYLKGTIKINSNILKSELDILNDLISKGVYYNEID